MTDPSYLVAACICLVVPVLAVVAAVVDSKPKPQPVKRRVSSNRKAAHR